MNEDILCQIAAMCDTETLCSMNIASKGVSKRTERQTKYHRYRKELRKSLKEYKETKKKPQKKKMKFYKIIDCLIKYSEFWMNESPDVKTAQRAIYTMCHLLWIPLKRKKKYIELLYAKHPKERNIIYNLVK